MLNRINEDERNATPLKLNNEQMLVTKIKICKQFTLLIVQEPQ